MRFDHAKTTLALALLAGLLLAGCPRNTTTPVGPPAFGPDLRGAPAAGTAAAAWKGWMGGDTASAADAFTTLSDALAAPPSPDAPAPPRAEVRFGQAELALHRADFDGALSHHLKLLSEDPEHPLAWWSAAQVLELRDYAPTWEDDVVAALDGLRDRDMTAEARALLGRSRAIARHRLHRLSDAPAPWDGARDGFAQRWRLAGPFSIYPLLDEQTPFPKVEQQERLAATYDARGFSLASRALTFDDPRFNPSYDTTGVYYAETWLQVRETTEALVSLEASSAITLWIDDQRLVERRLMSGYPPSLYGSRVTLPEGLHRIRVRLAVQNVEEPFALLITPTAGGDAPFAFSDTPPDGVARASLELHEQDLFTPPSHETARGHAFLLWLKARAEIQVGLHNQALVTLAALESLAPEFPQIPYLQGNAHRDDATQASNLRQEQALGFYRQTVERDPEAHFAADRLAFLLITQGQLDEALKILDGLTAKLPETYIVQYHRYLVFKDKGWDPQLRAALRRALERNPTNCTLVAAQWGLWRQRESTPDPKDLPPEFYGCDITWENLANAWDLPRGDLDAAIGRYTHLVARNPALTGYREVLARLLEHKGDRRAATRQYEAIRAANLDATYVDLQQLDATLAASGAEPTRAFITRRLDERPGSYELRRQLARLDSRPVLDGLHVDGLDVIRRHLASPRGTDAGSLYILDYAATRVFEDGSTLTLTHVIVRVLNKEGIDAYGELDLPGDALLLKVRTVKPDGRTMEPENIPGKASLSMPNLEPGDFVEYAYLQGSSGSLIRKGTYLGFRFFFHIADAPMLRSEYVLELPRAWEPDFELRHGAPDPEVTRLPTSTRYRFKVLDAPRAVLEPGAVPTAEIVPSIRTTHRYTWADVHQTYRDKLMSNLRPSAAIRAAVARVTAKVADPRERVRALFEYVLQEIDDDGSGPFVQPAAHIFNARAGDRLVLLAVMLKEAGIDSDILLGRSLDSDLTADASPDIDPWGYPLLRVRPGQGDPIWLDPSDTYALFDYIPPAVQGSDALQLGAADASGGRDALILSVPSQSSGQEQRVVDMRLAIDRKGDALGLATEIYQGSSGILLRQILDQYTDPTDFEQALAQALATSFPGLELQKLTVEGREDPDKPLKLDYKFTSKGFARVEGGAVIVERPVFPSRMEASFAPLPERQTTLAVLEPIEMAATLRLAFPKGTTAEIATGTQPVELSTKFGDFNRVIQARGAQVTIQRTLSVRLQRVSVEEYPSFKAFARGVDEGEGLKIIAR